MFCYLLDIVVLILLCNWLVVNSIVAVSGSMQVDNKLLRLGTNRTEEIRQELISASQLLVQLLVSYQNCHFPFCYHR